MQKPFKKASKKPDRAPSRETELTKRIDKLLGDPKAMAEYEAQAREIDAQVAVLRAAERPPTQEMLDILVWTPPLP